MVFHEIPVKKIVRKGENAGYQHFFLFQDHFAKRHLPQHC